MGWNVEATVVFHAEVKSSLSLKEMWKQFSELMELSLLTFHDEDYVRKPYLCYVTKDRDKIFEETYEDGEDEEETEEHEPPKKKPKLDTETVYFLCIAYWERLDKTAKMPSEKEVPLASMAKVETQFNTKFRMSVDMGIV